MEDSSPSSCSNNELIDENDFKNLLNDNIETRYYLSIYSILGRIYKLFPKWIFNNYLSMALYNHLLGRRLRENFFPKEGNAYELMNFFRNPDAYSEMLHKRLDIYGIYFFLMLPNYIEFFVRISSLLLLNYIIFHKISFYYIGFFSLNSLACLGRTCGLFLELGSHSLYNKTISIYLLFMMLINFIDFFWEFFIVENEFKKFYRLFEFLSLLDFWAFLSEILFLEISSIFLTCAL